MPRSSCICWAVSRRRSCPPKRTSPATMRPGGGTSPITENAETLLPHPDSPTMARDSPSFREKLTASTAFTVPRGRMKCVERSVTCSSVAKECPDRVRSLEIHGVVNRRRADERFTCVRVEVIPRFPWRGKPFMLVTRGRLWQKKEEMKTGGQKSRGNELHYS